MSWTVKIDICLAFFGFMVLQSLVQSHRIKHNLRIYHGWAAAEYALWVGIVSYSAMYLSDENIWWRVAIIGVTIRAALYNFILNKIRGLNWFYSGIGTTKSLEDKILNRLSKSAVIVLKCVAIAGFLALIYFL